MERIGVDRCKRCLESKISRTWWELDTRCSEGKRVLAWINEWILAGAEDVKRGAELAGKMMNEFSIQHVPLAMLVCSSQRQSQEKLGYYILYMASLAYGGLPQGMSPQFPVKGCHLSLWPCVSFHLDMDGSYRRSRDFSTNIVPLLYVTWDSHIWKFAYDSQSFLLTWPKFLGTCSS